MEEVSEAWTWWWIQRMEGLLEAALQAMAVERVLEMAWLAPQTQWPHPESG